MAASIERAVRQAAFTNVFRQRFDADVMKELYAQRLDSRYRLSNTDAIAIPVVELEELVSGLRPFVEPFSSPDMSVIGNGLYGLRGSAASPRLPSLEDYAKILVLAAARIGPERVVDFLGEWVEGQPFRVWVCALLKGARTDGALNHVDGLCLETLPSSDAEFPRSLFVQLDEHDIMHEQFAHRAILSLEHERGPALYSPTDDLPIFPPPALTIRKPELASVSISGLCRALSIEANSCIDWFRQWLDYGQVDAFFLNPGSSYHSKDASNATPRPVTAEQLDKSLELHGLLDGLSILDLGIERWHRSKGAATTEEQLVELRMAMESVLLADGKGATGEKRHRLAIRGAWLLGETFDQRKSYFRSLRDAYDLASTVLHAESLETRDSEKHARVISEAQDACRATILRIAKDQKRPDWTDIILGKEGLTDPN
ncbi:MAG: hypothetical protein OXI32_02350 [bacterium]|nr:hypothetical protein [bacterium]